VLTIVKMYCGVTQIMTAAMALTFQTLFFSLRVDCIDSVTDNNLLREYLDLRRGT